MKSPLIDFATRAFTLREVVISVTLIGLVLLLAAASLPLFGNTVCGARSHTMVLSNMRQLQLATQMMALDSVTNRALRDVDWTCTNGRPLRFAQWTNLLVSNHYLTERDLEKLLGSPRSNRTTNIINAFAVQEDDAGDTVFLATVNWMGPKATNLAPSPLQSPGFVVLRKAGEGNILKDSQCQRMDLIGTGGKFNYLPLQ